VLTSGSISSPAFTIIPIEHTTFHRHSEGAQRPKNLFFIAQFRRSLPSVVQNDKKKGVLIDNEQVCHPELFFGDCAAYLVGRELANWKTDPQDEMAAALLG
jgi:hypothetical protein